MLHEFQGKILLVLGVTEFEKAVFVNANSIKRDNNLPIVIETTLLLSLFINRSFSCGLNQTKVPFFIYLILSDTFSRSKISPTHSHALSLFQCVFVIQYAGLRTTPTF